MFNNTMLALGFGMQVVLKIYNIAVNKVTCHCVFVVQGDSVDRMKKSLLQ